MKVEVTRSGGVAGIPRKAAVEFTMRGAREAHDDEWAALYRAARVERQRISRQAGAAPSRVRDAFQWTLRFGRERFDLPDSTLSGALRELAEKVLAEGRQA